MSASACSWQSRGVVLIAAVVTWVAAFSGGALGQGSTAPAPGGFDQAYFQSLTWRNIGPNRGGRSLTATGSPTRPLEYYFGATGGGLWKTTDGGLTWAPVTDGQIRSSSVGAVAVAESNPDIVYMGMGEGQLRGNVMQGDGVYKSIDAGRTWTHVGLSDTQAIGRVRIHPANPEIVYVAALGHPYGPNDERGVFRTTDGGRTWKRILFRSNRAGAADLCLDPNDPRVLYATIWEVYRTPWKLSSGGEGSGVFKSVDGGDTWTELTRNPGMPKGIFGKSAVAVSRADSRRVWALIEAADGGVFRSDDAGATWTKLTGDRDLWQRAFFFLRIFADPKDRDTVYVLNVLIHKSTDGGKTYRVVQPTHSDQHDLWIDPVNPLRLIIANDNGGTVSVNGGKTWSAHAYPTAQMYHVATTKDFPYQVCGAQQDNDTACVKSEVTVLRRTDEISRPGSWYYVVGGNESGMVAPHPANPNIFYAGGQEAYLTRFDRTTGQTRDIQPYPWFYSGTSAGSVPERWQWTFPIVVSPLEPNAVYAASQHLWRTENEGQTWQRISPDLTRAAPETLGDSGGPITKDQNGPEFYATIFAVAPSRQDPRTIWVGSDDGLVHITRDGGRSWQRITPPNMKEFTRVSLIDASPHQPGTAYVAGKRHQLDDRAPYIWKTHDFGKTWTSIVLGIRAGDFVHAVREDPGRQGLLYAGTEHGVYVSFDDGAHWQSLSLNLPDTQVPDLVVEGRDLVIATHGRSFYVLDNIEILRQLRADVVEAPFHLFTPPDAVRRVYPATFDFFLRAEAKSVSVEILDGTGALVCRVPGRGFGTAGSHRVAWDLHYPGATVFPGMILRSAQPERGPLAPPGRYQVRLIVDGRSQTRDLAILKDPRLKDVTQADLEEQFKLTVQIRDKTSAANEAVIRIRDLRGQVAARVVQGGTDRVKVAAEALGEKLSAIELNLYQVRNQSSKDVLALPVKLNNRLAALMRVAQSAEARPTDQISVVFRKLVEELDVELHALGKVVDTDLSQFNTLLAGAGLEAVR
ncbi:MAG: glycosyl hydrolase [Acidobacteria bacterium]|nr:glycosyl hydrolase [Acidobacteriota bacterium]